MLILGKLNKEVALKVVVVVDVVIFVEVVEGDEIWYCRLVVFVFLLVLFIA